MVRSCVPDGVIAAIAGKRQEEIDITTGSLNEPDAYPPEWDAYDDEKVSWVPRAILPDRD